ncbi:hypothetical protein ASE13_17545 [Sphingomonas sp. Root241]|nr:hypothetical protein ASE13_17545 [Sphingomonas sp. Root241]
MTPVRLRDYTQCLAQGWIEILRAATARSEKDRNARPILYDPARKLDSVTVSRHLDVREYAGDAGVAATKELQCIIAAGSFKHREAPQSEILADLRTHPDVILHHEYIRAICQVIFGKMGCGAHCEGKTTPQRTANTSKLL